MGGAEKIRVNFCWQRSPNDFLQTVHVTTVAVALLAQ